MKRIVSLLLALMITFGASIALAVPDEPFREGIDYTQEYSDNGAVPSMLNFGSAQIAPGEWFDDKSVKKTTIEKISAKSLARSLGKMNYYIYAKWQNAYAFDYNFIDAMLVMTDPEGNYYATYGEWEQWEGKRNQKFYWYFDVTTLLERCLEDNGNELPRGQYTFSMFFNDQNFRVNKVLVT